jgi:MFS family permease
VSVPSASVVRNRDFVRLWTAQTISQFGTQVSLLAIPLVAVILLEASPFEVALLGTAEFLPFILFSLPAGAWVDRLRRRPILIAGDLGRALSLASIPIAHLAGELTIWQLYVVGFINGTLTVLFDVAYQSYLPSIVERDQLVDGNGKLELSRTVAQTAGPAIGGGLVGILTAPIAVVVDAISYAASAIFVFLIRREEPTPDRHVDDQGRPRESLRAEVMAGLRYVLGNPHLRGIALATGTSNLFDQIVFSIFLVYAVRDLGLSPGEIGVILGLGNIGAIVGAVTADRFARLVGLGPAMVLSMFASAPGLLLIALAPEGMPVPFLVASGFVFGLSVVVYNINQVSFRQAITPDAMQGRMNATMRFVVWGTIPIGQILGGVIATGVGVHEAIWVGAIGSFLGVVPLLISPVRRLREMPAPVDAADALPVAEVEEASEAERPPVNPIDPPGR